MAVGNFTGGHLLQSICFGLFLGACTSFYLDYQRSKKAYEALSKELKSKPELKPVEEPTPKKEEPPLDPELDGEEHNDSLETNYKVVCAIRVDLPMTKGKMAAQASHGVLAVSMTAYEEDPESLALWQSEDELLALCEAAENAGLIAEYIEDQGRTQIDPGSLTVVAIGPGLASVVDSITGKLKNL
ncbi:peptidyl-tRNA hydrolase PTH2-domain-containing protein [Chytridium lagenaria]|nr:peptidyl-tRNA hydrolase PTH2-domain-containing protein [Chytridium lagenaria]